MSSGNIVAMISAAAAACTIGAGVWKASEVKQGYDSQLARVNARIAGIEAGTAGGENAAIMRRLTALEHLTNDLNETSARMQADFGQLGSSTTGLSGQLAERVNELEARLANIPAGPSGEFDSTSFDRRLSALERRISGIASAGGSVSSPLVVQTEFEADLPSQTMGQLTVGLIQCQRVGASVDCEFLVRNDGEEEGYYFRANRSNNAYSSAVFPTGDTMRAAQVSVGDVSSRDSVSWRLPTGIPTRVAIRFAEVPRDLDGFMLVQLGIEAERLDFRSVRISG